MENLPLADFGRVLEKISSHVVRKTVTYLNKFKVDFSFQ